MNNNTEEVYISPMTSIKDVRGKYAYNKVHNTGGIILDGGDNFVNIDGRIYNTCTGDCFFDNLCINGFKVYEHNPNI